MKTPLQDFRLKTFMSCSYTYETLIGACHDCSGPAGGAVLTLSPECDALLLVCLTDAVVTVTVHTLTGVSVVQVHIRRALWVSAGAKLWQVAGVTRLPTRSTCELQLQTHTRIR